MLGTGVFLIFPFSFIGYISTLLFPRNIQHIVTITCTMIGLVLVHQYYELRDDSDYVFGIREVTMNCFTKQMVFAFNFKDGGSENTTKREKEYAVKKRPVLINYILY